MSVDDVIANEIERRSRRATKLMERYPELAKCETYTAFFDACEELGLELDFVTSCSMYEQFEEKKGADFMT